MSCLALWSELQLRLSSLFSAISVFPEDHTVSGSHIEEAEVEQSHLFGDAQVISILLCLSWRILSAWYSMYRFPFLYISRIHEEIMVSNQQTGDKQKLKTLLLDIDYRYVGHMALNFTVCLWKMSLHHYCALTFCITWKINCALDEYSPSKNVPQVQAHNAKNNGHWNHFTLVQLVFIEITIYGPHL